MKKLAIITTHPIQYNAPLFRLLSERKKITVKVFYTWGQSENKVFDAKFGIWRSWDIPMLNGYNYEFCRNVSRQPDSNRFFGVINPEIIRQLKAYQPDAILVYRWSLFSHLKIMQSFGRNPKLFFRGDSHLQNKEGGVKDKVKTILLKFVFRKIDKVFYVGRLNRDYFLKYGLSNDQLIAAPHAVDNQRFSSDQEQCEIKAAAERNELQIPVKAVVFLYAGKFYALKQLDLLIKAFQQLNGEEYRLLLYGNGEQETALRELAKSDDRIIFQPFKNQSEMPVVYRVGDVFLLPSKSETWGLAVNEAMACGRPAIVSNQCGCAPDLIIEGETGFTFHADSAESLLNCMKQINSKERAAVMGQRALKHIECFSLEKIAEVIEEELMK